MISMTRILADLPDDDIRWFDSRATEQGNSRALVLHAVVRWYRQHCETDPCVS